MLSLHRLLLGVVGLLALVVITLCGWAMTEALHSLRTASLNGHAARVVEATLDAYVAVSDERGRTAGVLGSSVSDAAVHGAGLDAVRHRTDRAHQRLVQVIWKSRRQDMAGQPPDSIEQLAQDYAELAAARRRADVAIAGGERLDAQDWVAVPTRYNDTLSYVTRDHTVAVYADGHSLGQPMLGLMYLYRVIKYTGLTRATVMAAISSGEPLSPATLASLDRYRAFIEETRAMLRSMPGEHNGILRRLAGGAFMGADTGDYDALLASVILASRERRPYAVTSEQWYASATTHLDTYIAQSGILTRWILGQAASSEAAARRQGGGLALLSAITVAALAATVQLLRRRLLTPLDALTNVANAVVRGDLDTPIVPLRRDEIGAMASAIEAMRRELLRRVAAITDAEAAAREQEAYLRSLLDNAAEAVIGTDQSGRVSLFNKAAESIFGIAQESVLGSPVEALVPAWPRLYTRGDTRPATVGAPCRIRARSQGRRADGSPFPVDLSVTGILTQHGAVEIILLRDLTELAAAEAAQKRLTDIIESTMDIVGTTDTQGWITYLNAAGRSFLGLGDDPRPGELAISRLLAPWAADQYRSETLPDALRRGVWQGDSAIVGSDGRETPVSHLVLRHTDAYGHTYLSFSMRDTAELTEANQELERRNRELLAAKNAVEQAHTQLVQSEKLAAVGQLAAGVAHEINNPIGYVSSNVASLAEYVDDLMRLLAAYDELERAPGVPPEVLARIDDLKRRIDLDYLRSDTVALVRESQEGLSRVRKIVQDLREFTHAGRADWQSADLHASLESTLNIVHNEIKYKAELVREYGEMPPVECMPAQLNQVFMNLLVNAAQAIEEHGTITVRTGTDGEWAYVEVEDDGPGMPEDVRRHLFEPFFTTKPVGKGTGLGLSVSYNIVQRHHGRIEVDSRPGHGSRFRVCIPLRQHAAAEEHAVDRGDARPL